MRYYIKYRPYFCKCRVESFENESFFKQFVSRCILDGRFCSTWSIDDDGNCHDYSIEEIHSILSSIIDEVLYERMH